MKKLIVTVFIIIICNQFVFAQNKLNEEWLNKDIQIFNNSLPVLISGEFDINTLTQITGIRISDEYGNLGLGYNKKKFFQSGGYTSVTITTLLDPE